MKACELFVMRTQFSVYISFKKLLLIQDETITFLFLYLNELQQNLPFSIK